MSYQVLQMIEDADRLREDAGAILRQSASLREKARALCTHDVVCDETTYITGGYDHVGQTKTSRTCASCGKFLGTTTEEHEGDYS